MTRTILISLSLCLSVGLGADLYAKEAPSVDQLMQDGSQAYQHGDFEQAVERWTQAAAAYERSGARQEQIDALIRLSEAYQSLGRYRTAAIRLDQAKTLVADRDDSLLPLRILWKTGSLYQAAGQHAEAERSLQESLRLAKTLPHTSLTAAILNDLGNVAASQGKFTDALAAYTESFQTAQDVPVKLLAATSLVNAARVSLPLKQYRESKQRLDQASDILRGLEPSHEQISAFITVGLTYAKLRAPLIELNTDLTLASFQALHEAARAADQLGDRRGSFNAVSMALSGWCGSGLVTVRAAGIDALAASSALAFKRKPDHNGTSSGGWWLLARAASNSASNRMANISLL